jgi:hypothetical protein
VHHNSHKFLGKYMNTSGVILFGLVVLSWLFVIAGLFTVVGETAMGDRDILLGVRWLLVGVAACVIWLCLGGLLWMAGARGIVSSRASWVAVALCIAAGAASVAALYLVSETEMRWPLAIAGVPPIVAAYVFAIYRPSLKPAFSSSAWQLAVAGLVAALAIPVFAAFAQLRFERSGRAQSEEQYAARRARDKEINLAKLQSMPEGASPILWFKLLRRDSGVRDEAIEVYKKLPRRQEDIERGLRSYPELMRLLPKLDLQATPSLCAAADDILVGISKQLESGARESHPYVKDTDTQLPFAGVNWLQAHGCSCDSGLEQIERAARGYTDSANSTDLRELLDTVVQMRQPH